MVNNLKNLKDRNPYWLIHWSTSEDGKPICCNTFHLIDFFKKNEKNKKEVVLRDFIILKKILKK